MVFSKKSETGNFTWENYYFFLFSPCILRGQKKQDPIPFVSLSSRRGKAPSRTFRSLLTSDCTHLEFRAHLGAPSREHPFLYLLDERFSKLSLFQRKADSTAVVKNNRWHRHGHSGDAGHPSPQPPDALCWPSESLALPPQPLICQHAFKFITATVSQTESHSMWPLGLNLFTTLIPWRRTRVVNSFLSLSCIPQLN